MRILTRYILREVTAHALIGAGIFTFVLFTRDLGRILELVVRASAPLRGIPGYRARIRPIVSRITIHWPSFYNVVTGKTLARSRFLSLSRGSWRSLTASTSLPAPKPHSAIWKTASKVRKSPSKSNLEFSTRDSPEEFSTFRT